MALPSADAYDDPHPPLHPTCKLQALLKKLPIRRKRVPSSSTVPWTTRNLEDLSNPHCTDTHDALLTVRPRRKVPLPEWLQLLS
jgi:hypothetical protein